MLELKQFIELEPNEVFATGETTGGYDTVNQWGKGQHLKWLAKTGNDEDWVIRIAPSDWKDEQILATGDYVRDRKIIKKFVPCDSAVLERYQV